MACARLGITLKVRGSVRRNALKRQIRESFRIVHSDLPAYDYNVVIPKLDSFDHKTIQLVRVSMDRFWQKEAKP